MRTPDNDENLPGQGDRRMTDIGVLTHLQVTVWGFAILWWVLHVLAELILLNAEARLWA